MKKGRVAIMGWDMILGFLREEGKGKTTVCGFYIMMNLPLLHSIFFTFIDDPLCYDYAMTCNRHCYRFLYICSSVQWRHS